MTISIICTVCTVLTVVFSMIRVARTCITKEDVKELTDTINEKFDKIDESLRETNRKFDSIQEQQAALRERVAVIEFALKN